MPGCRVGQKREVRGSLCIRIRIVTAIGMKIEKAEDIGCSHCHPKRSVPTVDLEGREREVLICLKRTGCKHHLKIEKSILLVRLHATGVDN